MSLNQVREATTQASKPSVSNRPPFAFSLKVSILFLLYASVQALLRLIQIMLMPRILVY